MNRLTFFKWIGKGAVTVVAAPLAKYLPESAPKTTVKLVKQTRIFGSPLTATEVAMNERATHGWIVYPQHMPPGYRLRMASNDS